jgi:hypothetical protein
VGVGFFVVFIIGTLLAGATLDGGGIPICLRSSSGEGIPGVGVAPGFRGFLSSSGLGIPGVGVAPFGSGVRFAGMPGGKLADGGSGLVDNPGGMLPLFALLTVGLLEQAKTISSEESKIDKNTILDIENPCRLMRLNRAVPA